MGTWGVAILSNDIAEDVSFRYKDLLGTNNSNEEASRIVIEENLNDLDDEEITTFWLSFALIQWKLGRLQDEVKNKALQIIDDGTNLERWEEDPQLKKKRKAVLHKLKKQLNSPQPQAKKVPKRFVSETPLKAGDAISYQLQSGDSVILKVIGIIEKWTGDKYPLFEICDWKGKEIPSKEQINQLDLKKELYANGDQKLNKLAIFISGKKDNPITRIRLIAEDVRILLDTETPYTLMAWKSFDDHLKTYYKYE